MESTIKVAVVYHSGFGHTKKQAEAVRDGAADVRDVRALLMDVTEAQQRWSDLEDCEAIVFGAPTYMGGASAGFKAFQHATSRAVMAKGLAWCGKLAAGFTNSGSRSGDKLSTLVRLALFSVQHGMHWINLGLPPANNSSRGSEEEQNRLGFFLGRRPIQRGPGSGSGSAPIRPGHGPVPQPPGGRDGPPVRHGKIDRRRRRRISTRCRLASVQSGFATIRSAALFPFDQPFEQPCHELWPSLVSLSSDRQGDRQMTSAWLVHGQR